MAKSNSEERLAVLEQRLAAVEYKFRLLWSSSLGHELRGLEHSQRQRRVEQEEEQRHQERRAVAADARTRTFKWFARERVAVHSDLAATEKELFTTYNDWCYENKMPRLHRFECDAELQATMQTVFPDVEEADVPPEGYLGRPGYTVPGYDGIGLVPDGQSPAEWVRQLKTEVTQKRAARKATRELEEVLHPTPTRPPPAFRTAAS